MVEADRWRRINELFHEALEHPADEREAYLEEECGDDEELRGEVGSLLRSHAAADKFIERPAFVVAEDLVHTDAAQSPPPESLIGATIGSYAVRAVLGTGGMGVVYLAEDTRLHRKVALKALANHLCRDRRSRDRLRREAQAAASLSHPGIATVFALEEIDDRLYIAYEYADGPTLRQELRSGPLPAPRLHETAAAIAGALQAAHARGIVHRDLKPENVIRLVDGGIKVLDFGLATFPQPAVFTRGEGDRERLTLPGMLLGTPSYMSPEQLQGREADFRSDLFSLGIVLSELATGVHPFEGDNAASTIARILEVEPRNLPVDDAEADCGMDAILRRLLAKRPEDRYESTADLVEELNGLLSGKSTSAATAATARAERTSARPAEVAPASVAAAATVELRARPSAPSRGPLWWWRFHQFAIAAVYGATLVGLWWARRYSEETAWALAGLVLLYGGVAFAIVAGSLRLHLAFASHYYPEQLPRQVDRASGWIRPAEFCYCALLLGGAFLLGLEHPLPAALMVAAATGIIVFAVNIEPATTRAAFPAR